MKVLVTGKGGQLASELEITKPSSVEFISLSFQELDITKEKEVLSVVESVQPDVVINAAAYTAVDKAELERESAFSVNEIGARNLALACQLCSARLLHISTDFVFDGKNSTPYLPESKPNPLNVYGASKLAGDIAVNKLLPNSSIIVRTAWVYSVFGNNFVKSMIKLLASKPSLNVVYDQIGTPTWAKGLAKWLWAVSVEDNISGVYHWTDAGVASWYDFAVAIQDLALQKGILEKEIPIKPIPSASYPTAALRPAFSVLDKSLAESIVQMDTAHWRKQLSSMLDEFINEGHS